MNYKVHPTAIIDPSAVIGEGCEIGPYCIIGPKVILGKNNLLLSHVIVNGPTTLGDGNKISSFAVIGTDPQDLKYNGEDTFLEIGNNNTIRESVTINRSNGPHEPTRVGDNNLLMAYAHIAHNCQIGNYIVIANSVNFAGHVTVGDFAILGGLTAIHQFVKIGAYSFIGGCSAVKKDIPPYVRGQGNPFEIHGLNGVGLLRKGFSSETVMGIKRVYKLFYRKGLNTTQAIEEAEKMDLTPEQKLFVEFVKNGDRGLTK
ncbi:MAG: acyl-ACP--UDP-N-acetylglucosamine O-acyltransferase [Candidatus Cloacimonetes bacterium]|nr:acyl-ACP--UDP-N-acetylglucosamine O-acyltransferase [Candidatus Cloacimonadota bacterium]